MEFIDIIKNIKNKSRPEKRKKEPKSEIIDLTGKVPKPWKPSKAYLAREKIRDAKYPISLSVDIHFNKSNRNKAFEARNEIADKWSSFGSWIGQGADVGYSGDCDVQVAFSEKDIAKAKSVATTIMKKYGVDGDFGSFNINQK